MSQIPRIWLITGVSSGFGRGLAEAVLKRGEQVIGTLRNAAQLAEFESLAPGRAFAVQLDVTDRDAIFREIPAAIRRAGGVDVVVNNAGYGLAGAIEEISDEEARHVMETNFFGTLEVIQAALPFLREKGSGHILNLSSLAGIQGFGGMGLYNASKFAVEGLSEALAAELAPFGIKVTLIAPGSFRTAFAGRSIVIADKEIEAYATTSGRVRHGIPKADGLQPGDPAKAVAAMIAVVDSTQPPLRLALGEDGVAGVRNKIKTLARELEAWEKISRDTAFT